MAYESKSPNRVSDMFRGDKNILNIVVTERIVLCSKEGLLFVIVGFGLTNRSAQSYPTDVYPWLGNQRLPLSMMWANMIRVILQ